MSRHPTERHNDEFRDLFNLFMSDNNYTVRISQEKVSELLGVSVDCVRQWLKPTTSKNATACAKHRVDAFKLALGIIKMKSLTPRERARILDAMGVEDDGKI